MKSAKEWAEEWSELEPSNEEVELFAEVQRDAIAACAKAVETMPVYATLPGVNNMPLVNPESAARAVRAVSRQPVSTDGAYEEMRGRNKP